MRIITYGTFDLFHVGHLRLLERASQLGAKTSQLVVYVSTDEFCEEKGKKPIIPFADRIKIIRSLKCVDYAYEERSWNQKKDDMKKSDLLVMGNDWNGKFDYLETQQCKVVYLPRTSYISTTTIKQKIADSFMKTSV